MKEERERQAELTQRDAPAEAGDLGNICLFQAAIQWPSPARTGVNYNRRRRQKFNAADAAALIEILLAL